MSFKSFSYLFLLNYLCLHWLLIALSFRFIDRIWFLFQRLYSGISLITNFHVFPEVQGSSSEFISSLYYKLENVQIWILFQKFDSLLNSFLNTSQLCKWIKMYLLLLFSNYLIFINVHSFQ